MRKWKSKFLQASGRGRDEKHVVKEVLSDDTRTYKSIPDTNYLSVAMVREVAGRLEASPALGTRTQTAAIPEGEKNVKSK